MKELTVGDFVKRVVEQNRALEAENERLLAQLASVTVERDEARNLVKKYIQAFDAPTAVPDRTVELADENMREAAARWTTTPNEKASMLRPAFMGPEIDGPLTGGFDKISTTKRRT